MADEVKNNKSTTPTGSKNREEGSIVDRKIERRGLPSGFSSNLVRPRNSPPRQRDETTSCGKSVKSIVNFFENSKSNTASSASVDNGSTKSKATTGKESRLTSSTTNTTSTNQKPLVPHQSSLANVPDVEEYSLTLLKYRQYFTNQPLGRCLDGQNQTTQVKSPPSAQSNQVLHDPKKGQVESQRLEAKGTPSWSIINAPIAQGDRPQELIHRNPQEVAAFWNHVRNYLWISDEELESAADFKNNETTVLEPAFLEDDSVLSPHVPPPGHLRSNHKTDLSASQRSLNEQRRFLASTERQISEIDAYISNKHRHELNSPLVSSPTSTLPSPLASPTYATTNVASSKTHSTQTQERCTSCSKIRVSQDSSGCPKSGPLSDRPPPPRAPMNLSRRNAGRIVEPPVLDAHAQEWNFF